MNPKKFDHTKADISDAMGISRDQLDRLMLWGADTSKNLVLGKLSNVDLAEKISAELTDEEIILFAALFVQQMTDRATKTLPSPLISFLQKLKDDKNLDVNVVRVDSKENLSSLIKEMLKSGSTTTTKQSEEQIKKPLSERSNSYGQE